MEINYELREKDYLNFQLYYTATNESVKTRRWLTQFIVVVIVVVIATYIFITGDKWISYYVFAAAIPAYFLFAFYTKLLYRFSLRNHVAALYRRTTPRKAYLIINDSEITYKEQGNATHSRLDAIQEIINIRNYIYLKFGQTSYIIIPKKQLDDSKYIELRFKDIARTYKIKYTSNLHWKWK